MVRWFMGKDACHQTWRPEFDPWIHLVEGETRLPWGVLWPPCGTHPQNLLKKKSFKRVYSYFFSVHIESIPFNLISFLFWFSWLCGLSAGENKETCFCNLFPNAKLILANKYSFINWADIVVMVPLNWELLDSYYFPAWEIIFHVFATRWLKWLNHQFRVIVRGKNIERFIFFYRHIFYTLIFYKLLYYL